jgi:hypothetical protein
MNQIMTTSNEPHPNFDPCGDTSPDGCFSCPNSGECFPQESPYEVKEVVGAYVTFHLDSGEVNVLSLDEFLENIGVFEDDEDDDEVERSIQGSLLEDLVNLIQIFQIELPMRLTLLEGQLAEIDLVAGQYHLSSPEDLDDLRHLENLMSTERWGEEYEPWD